jgi:hypothetical protein
MPAEKSNGVLLHVGALPNVLPEGKFCVRLTADSRSKEPACRISRSIAARIAARPAAQRAEGKDKQRSAA